MSSNLTPGVYFDQFQESLIIMKLLCLWDKSKEACRGGSTSFLKKIYIFFGLLFQICCLIIVDVYALFVYCSLVS